MFFYIVKIPAVWRNIRNPYLSNFLISQISGKITIKIEVKSVFLYGLAAIVERSIA